MKSKHVLKRDGSIEDFDFNKIKTAIHRAMCDIDKTEKVENYILPLYLDRFEEKIFNLSDEPVSSETLQEMVELFLMKRYPAVAKTYILYRYKHM